MKWFGLEQFETPLCLRDGRRLDEHLWIGTVVYCSPIGCLMFDHRSLSMMKPLHSPPEREVETRNKRIRKVERKLTAYWLSKNLPAHVIG